MLQAEWEREKRAVAASILPLFFPRSIAVIGASSDPASIGGRLFRNILNGGFTGPLYPVNPKAKVIGSVRAYPTIGEVPDEVDLAYIVVPQAYVIDVARQCAASGVRGIVVISAGFSETGEEGCEARGRASRDRAGFGDADGGPQLHGTAQHGPLGPAQRHVRTGLPTRRQCGHVQPVRGPRHRHPRLRHPQQHRDLAIRVRGEQGGREWQRPDSLLGGRPADRCDHPLPGVVRQSEEVLEDRQADRASETDHRGQVGPLRVREPCRLLPHRCPRLVGCGRAGPVPPGRSHPGRHDRGAVRRRQPPRPPADPCGWAGRDRHQRRWARDPRGRRARGERADAPRALGPASGANRLQAPGRGLDQEPGRSDRIGRAH